jgi:hypothetical protein
MKDYIDFIDLLNLSEKKYKFYVFLIVFISIYILIQYNVDYHVFIYIIISVFFIYYNLTKEQGNANNFNIDMNYKISVLNSILFQSTTTIIKGKKQKIQIYVGRPSMLYTDPNITNLLYSCIEYNKYAPNKFFKVLKFINELLITQYEIDYVTINHFGNYNNARKFSKNILNYFQSFIHVIPQPLPYKDKFNTSLKRLHLLIKRILDNIKIKAEEKEKGVPLNTKSRFIIDNDGPVFEDIKNKDIIQRDYEFFKRI